MHRALYFVSIVGRHLIGVVKILLDLLNRFLQIREIHSQLLRSYVRFKAQPILITDLILLSTN
jgi:hypothetical protein